MPTLPPSSTTGPSGPRLFPVPSVIAAAPACANSAHAFRAGIDRYKVIREQSEEGHEDIPGAGTNRRSNKRIYPGRGPIGGPY
eukprot:5800324-Pyramimonas_sp.AAC.1